MGNSKRELFCFTVGIMALAMSDEELNKFFKSWKTVQELLKDRKYLIGDEDLNLDFASFKQRYEQNARPGRENFRIHAAHETNTPQNEKYILVFFPDDEKLSVSVI